FADRPARAAFLDSLERRRCIKSHTPMDGIPYGPDPTYIVVFRHPVDVHFSLRAHVANMKHDLLDHLFPEDEQAGFSRFLTGPLTEQGTDDLTLASLSRHYLQARAREDGGNVHFFHYADLSRDLRGQIIRLAGILDIQLPDQIIDEIAAATTFTSMRAVIETSDERFGDNVPFHDMAKFYDSGTSNKWKGRLSDKDMAAYASRFAELMPADDIAWFEWGDRRHP
ncbi:MAG: sulfotransferase domain-containing protein, partial [Pseudomonadota bacterium]